jgi:hypothetical protein
MTREEKIEQAATAYEQTIIVDHFSCDTEIDFSEGRDGQTITGG